LPTVIRPTSPVARILLGNPENARAARPSDSPEPAAKDDSVKAPTLNLRPGVADVDVLLLGPTEIFLLGKTVGSTNVVMLDRSGRCTAFDVVVGMDTAGLRAVLNQLLPDEKGITLTPAFDSVVLSGQVSDAEALARVTDLANAFVRGQSRDSGGAAKNARIVNMLDVGAPQQVMLEVKVAEISKSLLDSFGVDFSRAYVGDHGSVMRFLSGIFGGGAGVFTNLSGTGPNGVPLSSVGTVVGGTVTGAVSAGNSTAVTQGGNVTVTYDAAGKPLYTTTYGTVPAKGVTNAALNMQKTDGLVKVLAEPTVMAISGQTGSFLAGGKILIPIIQTADGGGRTITLDEKEFGISVKFTPTVMGGGRINLKVKPEVSELNAAGVVIGSGNFSTVLPSFTSRKAETTVQLMDGQSFAIGGLIKNNTTTNVKAFPFLGEIPVLGALFRSTEFQTDKSELVFVITPRLVKPLPADYRLRAASKARSPTAPARRRRPPAASTPRPRRPSDETPSCTDGRGHGAAAAGRLRGQRLAQHRREVRRRPARDARAAGHRPRSRQAQRHRHAGSRWPTGAWCGGQPARCWQGACAFHHRRRRRRSVTPARRRRCGKPASLDSVVRWPWWSA
jgi:pilus assembly protein CpaC